MQFKNNTIRYKNRIFKSYWELGDYSKRFNFAKSLINIKPKSRVRQRKHKKFRKYTAQYHLNAEESTVIVCKTCFLKTLGETESFIKNVTNKTWSEMNRPLNSDNRGRARRKNKTSHERKEKVKEHILKFPSYESHYSRSHTSKKYLPCNLDVSKMHKLYKKEVSNPVSIKIYRKIFKKTGLKFKQPQLDSCHKCDVYANAIKNEKNEEKKNQILKNQEIHHKKAELGYNAKAVDKSLSENFNGKYLVARFDLQQCLPTPNLHTSVSFYKRSLRTYNLTIHSKYFTKCYMWHEGIAYRGANEIASCLYKFLSDLDPKVQHICTYADSFPGQTRNNYLAGMFSAVSSCHSTLKIIDHKFLEPGHTHMECDSDHALIEKVKKKALDIHVPEDWYKLVRSVQRKNISFEVIEMTTNDFYDFEKLFADSFVKRKLNEDK